MRDACDIAWPRPLVPGAALAALRWFDPPGQAGVGHRLVRDEPGLRVERVEAGATLGLCELAASLVYELDELVRIELVGWPRDTATLAELGGVPDAEGWCELELDGTRLTLDLVDGVLALEPEA